MSSDSILDREIGHDGIRFVLLCFLIPTMQSFGIIRRKAWQPGDDRYVKYYLVQRFILGSCLLNGMRWNPSHTRHYSLSFRES